MIDKHRVSATLSSNHRIFLFLPLTLPVSKVRGKNLHLSTAHTNSHSRGQSNKTKSEKKEEIGSISFGLGPA